ncbi:hypothetical protein GTQ99_19600 [Kineococcus sp. T13]|uniref:hypothetical protein n=1 Tax=Kineococcus vitellinus TaxID=2696565 RepID=UPI0014130C0D|nr:hypothetical protein [Kineococcus vitellinus]NAZ77599.1 hypothetical protein [Kineococcus vitellinus]
MTGTTARSLLRGVRGSRTRGVQLSGEAARVVEDLRRDGIACTSTSALAPGSQLLEEVLSRTDDLVADQSADIVRRRRALAGDPLAGGDAHRVDLLGASPPVDPEDPYARFLRHPQVAGIAAAHCRRDVVIWDVNGRLTLAAAASHPAPWQRAERSGALEVHLHLTAVDGGTGPLHYLRGSHRRRGPVPRAVRALERSAHVDDDALRALLGEDARTSALGGAGTVVFLDPRGLHRTDRPTTRDRLVLHGRYAAWSARAQPVLRPAETVPRSLLPDFALV